MKKTAQIMGMPISVEIIGASSQDAFSEVFDYFRQVDERFSTYKPNSEISLINRGLPMEKWSRPMKQVMKLCETTRAQTQGYFNIKFAGRLDPSGLVKGWAINNAAKLLKKREYKNFYINAGGDIQVSGHNQHGRHWRIGIENPFNRQEIIKVIEVGSEGVATSGTYIRGQHIYNPHQPRQNPAGLKSITVIGPDIYEADRMATAAHAMGAAGINFIETLPDFEAYQVGQDKIATMTSGFGRYSSK